MLKIVSQNKSFGNLVRHVRDEKGNKVGHITEVYGRFVPVKYRKFRMDQMLSQETLEQALEKLTNG